MRQVALPPLRIDRDCHAPRRDVPVTSFFGAARLSCKAAGVLADFSGPKGNAVPRVTPSHQLPAVTFGGSIKCRTLAVRGVEIAQGDELAHLELIGVDFGELPTEVAYLGFPLGNYGARELFQPPPQWVRHT